MIEGGGSRTWEHAKRWLYEHPAESRTFLRAISDIIVKYLVKQYDAGAPVLQVFDSNAGEISPALYEKFHGRRPQVHRSGSQAPTPPRHPVDFPEERTAFGVQQLRIRHCRRFLAGFAGGSQEAMPRQNSAGQFRSSRPVFRKWWNQTSDQQHD